MNKTSTHTASAFAQTMWENLEGKNHTKAHPPIPPPFNLSPKAQTTKLASFLPIPMVLIHQF